MSRFLMASVVGLSLIAAAPAFAGGKNALNVNLGVATGKGGLVGTLLGTPSKGPNGLVITTAVATSKNGVLGLLLGGGKGGHGGCGC
jgi:hypothetical protein